MSKITDSNYTLSIKSELPEELPQLREKEKLD